MCRQMPSLPRRRFFGCHVTLPQKKLLLVERYVTSKKTAARETTRCRAKISPLAAPRDMQVLKPSEIFPPAGFMKTGLATILQVLSTCPCFNLFTVLLVYCVVCLCLFFFSGCFVIRDCVDVVVDRILRISIYHPPPSSFPSSLFCFVFFSRPTILCLTQVTVI